MSDRLKHLALTAAVELRQLRKERDLLAARVETLDLLAAFLFAKPPQQSGVGMGEDVAWAIDRELERLKESV